MLRPYVSENRSRQRKIRTLALAIVAVAGVVSSQLLFKRGAAKEPGRSLEQHAIIKLPEELLAKEAPINTDGLRIVTSVEQQPVLVSQAIQAMLSVPAPARNTTVCRWTERRLEEKVVDCLIEALPDYKINPNVIFFGDSTMARFWYRFYRISMPYSLPLAVNDYCNCETRILDRCFKSGQEKIFDKRPTDEWIQPNASLGEGPTAYGVGSKGKGCMDCRSCHSRLTFCSESCSYTPPSYFGVEFARDVSLQTRDARTTQESTAALLQRRFPRSTDRRQLCVVNVGMHDFAVDGMHTDLYVRNVKWYLSLLRPSCDHVLWVSLNQVTELKKYPQNNMEIVEWNEEIEILLKTPEFSSWTTVLDIFTITSKWEHENPVHIAPAYYAELAVILADSVLVEPEPF